MATTGTTAFDLNLLDLIEEAWERATGDELRTGYELRTARRSLNLLTLEWHNRGLNLWTLQEGTVPLLTGTASYTLPADTVDLLEMSLRTGTGETQVDYALQRLSFASYAQQVNKNLRGRPTQGFINRVSPPTITLWPVPDIDSYTLYYWRMRRIQDAGTNTETQDIPFRFLPPLVSGLAFYIATKVPKAYERIPMLKEEYESQLMMASHEDRERASWRIVPRMLR